jgi:hypothetical protein
MKDEIKNDDVGIPGNVSGATAVRVYEHADASTEFPVLKAFQEYLEAEQAKANKRMLSLSIFFIVLLVIVVLTFSVIALFMINRNQTLSDRLMDIALRERAAALQQPASVTPVVNVQQPAPVDDSARLKPILAKLEAMESELVRARAAAAKAQPAAPTASHEDSRSSEKLRAVAAREAIELAKQQAAVKAAREKLKAEQELLRKEEIERQRRRLYPEFYAQEDARKAAEEAAKNPPPPRAESVKPSATPPVKPISPPAPAEVAVKPNPPPAPATQKKSALQILLEHDDAPSAAATTKSLSDEDADKVDAELRSALLAASSVTNSTPAVSKPQQATKPSSLPTSSLRPESIDIGAKDGSTIPWLLGDMNSPVSTAPVTAPHDGKAMNEKKAEQKKPEEKNSKQDNNRK